MCYTLKVRGSSFFCVEKKELSISFFGGVNNESKDNIGLSRVQAEKLQYNEE